MNLTKDLFLPLLHSTFTITFDAVHAYEAELIQVREHKKIESLNLEPFTLTFRGDKDETVYQQGNYILESKATGRFQLFLIPRLPDKEGIYYDAIIH